MKSKLQQFLLVLLLGLVGGAGGASASFGESSPLGNARAELQARVAAHGFPAIFQAWSSARNLNRAPETAIPLSSLESREQTLARHDLIFLALSDYGLSFNHPTNAGLSSGFTPESVQQAQAFRARLLALNPHAVLLAEIRYHDAQSGYFPDDSLWWQRDASGQRVRKTQGTSLNGYYLLDLSAPGLQDRIAALCAATIDTGVVDGCMLDWWSQDDADHEAIARKIRERIGDRGLLLVNVNGRLPTRSAPYINGMFMEGFGASFFADWKTAVKNLQWAAGHLRPPAFTAFEMWYAVDTPAARTNGPDDLARLRFATTLSLCNSDGYLLYSAGFPTPGHPHDWYAFWKQTLGAPTEAPGRITRDGAFARKFQHGSVTFNPPDNREVSLEFAVPVVRRSTEEVGTHFAIPPGDGDIFINK